jgi:transcriptional regulator with XRE-family HTH domain
MTVAIRIRDYQQLTQALASRRRSLGLRQLDADEKSGLASGYVGKIEANVRKLGDLSLQMLLAAYDCDLLLAPRTGSTPVERRPGSAGLVHHLNGETP